MKRKRFVKLLMARSIERNKANEIAALYRVMDCPYKEYKCCYRKVVE